MSTTFADTPIHLGDKPSTFGEMREMAQGVHDTPVEHWDRLFTEEKTLMASFVQGITKALVFAIDELEKERSGKAEV